MLMSGVLMVALSRRGEPAPAQAPAVEELAVSEAVR
jgi:hypothetical protein